MASRKKPQHGAAARNRRSTKSGRASSTRGRSTPKAKSRPKATSRAKTAGRTKTTPRSKATTRPKTPNRSKASARPKAAARPASRSKSRSRALLIPIAVVALLALMMWSFYPVARIQYQESREKARLEAELVSLQERNEVLRSQVDRLKTPEGVEEIARESLGMVKDGEHVYVVTNLLEETTNTVAGCTSIAEPPPTFSQSILDDVFGFGE